MFKSSRIALISPSVEDAGELGAKPKRTVNELIAATEQRIADVRSKYGLNEASSRVNFDDGGGLYRANLMDGSEDLSSITRQRGYPLGFDTYDEFVEFGSDLNNDLRKSGVQDAISHVQGSAVTGRSFETGRAFDEGRISDFDIAISSPNLLQRAKSLGAEIRGDGNRTGPINLEYDREILRGLGLHEFASKYASAKGRSIEFMITDSVETVQRRGASVYVPEY